MKKFLLLAMFSLSFADHVPPTFNSFGYTIDTTSRAYTIVTDGTFNPPLFQYSPVNDSLWVNWDAPVDSCLVEVKVYCAILREMKRLKAPRRYYITPSTNNDTLYRGEPW